MPLDASPTKSAARPVRKLQITQTLDERQSDKGKLLLDGKPLAATKYEEVYKQLGLFSADDPRHRAAEVDAAGGPEQAEDLLQVLFGGFGNARAVSGRIWASAA